MTWNPDNFYGITTVRLPISAIWLPDIILQNRYHLLAFLFLNEFIVLRSSNLETSLEDIDILPIYHDFI